MQFEYNGIQLQIIKTHQYLRQAVYSSDNGDWICNRYLLEVTGVLNPDATSYDSSGSQVSGQFPVVTDTWIRHQLLSPGELLIYSDEAANVSVTSPPAGNSVDAMYGPHPIDCNVKQIAGTKTFIVSFQIETWLNDCPGVSGSVSPVASNRWTNTHHIDRNQITTITYHGETILRKDALEDANQIADHFRGECLPACPLGFRRMGLQCQVSSIGDRLIWQVTDQEQEIYLGDGSNQKANIDVLSFTGEYKQETTSSGGSAPSGVLSQSVAIQVIGKPHANRVNLLLFAIKLAIQRLQLPIGPINAATDPMVSGIAIGEMLHEPVVNYYMSTTLPCSIQGIQAMGGLRFGAFEFNGFAFQYNNPYFDNTGKTPTLGADNNTRSSSYTGLAFSAALQDACSTPPLIPISPASGSQNANYPIAPAYYAYVTVGDSPPPSTAPQYSQANAISGPYTEYRIDARLDGDNHVTLLPTTGTVTGDTSQSEVVSLANRTNMVAFNWTAERQFNPPTAPSPFINDQNYTLIKDTYEPSSVALMADGYTAVYRMSGRFEYVLSKSVASASALNFPTPPLFTMLFGNVGQSDYQSGIIGSLSGSGSGSTGGGSSSFAGMVGNDG